jgi:hypothetical protein
MESGAGRVCSWLCREEGLDAVVGTEVLGVVVVERVADDDEAVGSEESVLEEDVALLVVVAVVLVAVVLDSVVVVVGRELLLRVPVPMAELEVAYLELLGADELPVAALRLEPASSVTSQT